MKHDKNSILVTILLFALVLSLFVVSADDSQNDIENDGSGNNTTLNNTTNKTGPEGLADAPIQPMSWSVSLTVNPTSYNMGTIPADGVERSFTGATTARVQATGLLSSGDLFIRASGNFINGANASQTIPLNNFQFESPNYATKRPLTTTDFSIHHYTMFWSWDNTYNINYYLTVPRYTDPGTYSTTVIYTAT